MNKYLKYTTPYFKHVYNIMKIKDFYGKWENYNIEKGYTEITYSFPNWSALRGNKYTTITTFTEKGKDLVREKLQQWEEVANIKFIEVSGAQDTDIKFGLYNNINEIGNYKSYSTAGYAYFPKNPYPNHKKNDKIESAEDYSTNGQVWVNMSKIDNIEYIRKSEITPEQQIRVNQFKSTSNIINHVVEETDNYYCIIKNSNALSHINNTKNIFENKHDFQRTINHEIGHALGLQHTFKRAQPFDCEENSHKYSIMAYSVPKYEHADFNGMDPLTPQLMDIFAIQEAYGQNKSTRIGNTIYGFNSNTKKDYYSLKTSEDKIVACIWDTGGIDTLDFSKYTVDQKIDLNEGGFSDVGGLRANISIAYGAVIENAIGGSQTDIISGNDANNSLFGNLGDDTLYGKGGNDILYGGQGNDYLYGEQGNDHLYGEQGDDYLIGSSGNDRLYGGQGDDYLWDSEGDNIFDGGLGNDVLFGGNGDDELNGGEGNDHLDPGMGNNTLKGGTGYDIFSFNTQDNDSSNIITDFESNIDNISFYKETDNGIVKHAINIVNSNHLKNNEGNIYYDNVNNITKLKINTTETLTPKYLNIYLVGKYEHEDLFC
ncbi:M10 family metallopeptidase C-terminal domain-containing protein [Proteus penneri]|uniref:serralysin n=1 Tax=Proteus penneri TaxID=102862 RepID=A0A0G4Q6E3_9GAMM|nr:M10 family metallopeptidase C-terminal domain-containing protein [Proteus penneri]CRL61472.1 Serralysin precursor [Proteus penneri]